MKCRRCNKHEAVNDPFYGVLPCQECQDKEQRPQSTVEFTTDSIRSQRREFRKDIIQPYRDGVISKEFIEEYGPSGFSKEQIKQAEYVWKDTSNWHDRDKSRGGTTELRKQKEGVHSV